MAQQKHGQELRQDSEASESQNPLLQQALSKQPSMGLFALLPKDLYQVALNYLSLKELGYLAQVSKFFMELTREIIFFSARTKDEVHGEGKLQNGTNVKSCEHAEKESLNSYGNYSYFLLISPKNIYNTT